MSLSSSNENGNNTNGMDHETTATTTTTASVSAVVATPSGEEKAPGGVVVSIEDLYRLFGVLADANDQAGQVGLLNLFQQLRLFRIIKTGD